jgi:hypothetical protein
MTREDKVDATAYPLEPVDQQHVDERRLQRAVQAVLGDPAIRWRCTDGSNVQIVASGMINPFDGPDFRDMAILHDGVLHVGTGEFHRRASEWYRHGHDDDRRYEHIMMHIVMVDDCSVPAARWTLVLRPTDVARGMAMLRRNENVGEVPVEELQHQALLRLLRLTTEADVHVRRVGRMEACVNMTNDWIERLSRKRHRPIDGMMWDAFRRRFPQSIMGRLLVGIDDVEPERLLEAIDAAEAQRIGIEGQALRREIFVNAVLPVLCAVAADSHRVMLLQWYWTARSVHPYGALLRRYPSVPQSYVWQQQGIVEFQRQHGSAVSTCADVVRQYGFDSTLRFLKMASG